MTAEFWYKLVAIWRSKLTRSIKLEMKNIDNVDDHKFIIILAGTSMTAKRVRKKVD